MTCIVGIAEGGNVFIGGDSAGVAGYSLKTRADTKVFTKPGGWVFGFTSSFRMGQLLHHVFEPPAHDTGTDLEQYLVGPWVDALRQCLKDGGYASKDSEVERGGTFLFGVNGRLFRVESDYQVAETIDGFDAVGCGEDIALGSLHSTRQRMPTERIEMALEAAERFSAGVRAPFVIKSTAPPHPGYACFHGSAA